ncbi:hypothetical protein KXD40_009049 [Peronospora effusa]|uniref:RxLR effector protein n=1 Tax=Peronospora effusa TaxID=542832 RepID=A0A3M6VLD8_9STRA|nr:hypothetical protein DD238_003787 [Peronospora effusa]RQM13660.1 hypothetical protein DD237_003977 [Peronospora effusa]UIZ25203.1 hypothetical protein KXD40_009049 [Peronospora effusa]
MRIYLVAFFVLTALLANGEAAKSLTGKELIMETFTDETKATNQRALRDTKQSNTDNIEDEERLWVPKFIINLLKKVSVKVKSKKVTNDILDKSPTIGLPR